MLKKLKNKLSSQGGASNYGSINSISDSCSTSSHVDIPDSHVGTADDPSLAGGPQMTMSGRWLLDSHPPKSTSAAESRRNLSMFSGVFSPIALSMFSTVLFLRLGFIVGNSGILETLLQFILAYSILYMTILSICAVSTNGAIEGGGAYYMISRALGPEFGGSIGFLFFFANIIACALYISAFTEGLVSNFGQDGGHLVAAGTGLPATSHWWSYLYSTIVLLFCLIVCLLGGSMFAKTVVFIFAVIVICTGSVIVSVFVTHWQCVPIVEQPMDECYIEHHHKNHTVPTPPSANSSNHVLCRNYTGLSWQTFQGNLYPHYDCDYATGLRMSFVTVFAVLFSSVTGIMNGANMSGELKAPSRAIPVGTLAATSFTFITYLILVFLVSASNKRELLLKNYGFLQPINVWPPFIAVGTFCVTLSAALGNLIGASRILEALAKDGLFWKILKPATFSSRGGNPYIAVLLSWILVQLMLLIGTMNAIAPLASVFFLMSYAGINLACLALQLASAPNFRPTFRYFTWHTCLLGLLSCLVMCFLVSAVFASVALAVCLLLVILLHLRDFPTSWGSISQALIFHQVRKYLLLLDSRKDHVKFWRPQMLLLVANPRTCCDLIKFVNDIKKGGLYVLGHVKRGHFDDVTEDPCTSEYPLWQTLIDTLKVKAFAELTLSDSVRSGVHHLIRLSGLGGMKPNTILLGFHDDAEPRDSMVKLQEQRASRWRLHTNHADVFEELSQFPPVRSDTDEKLLGHETYVQLVCDIMKMQKNVCLCRGFHQLDHREITKGQDYYFINVWPVNFFDPTSVSFLDNTCLFMLQLACILHMVPGWKTRTTVRVFLCVSASSEDVTARKEQLHEILRQLRIPGLVKLVPWDKQLSAFPKSENNADSAIGGISDESIESQNSFQDQSMLHYLTEINQLVQENSDQTAVSFLYLPQPPIVSDGYRQYLEHLAVLTNGLPPSLLVHGFQPVTSTNL